jgi:hypothetical protein
MALLVTNISTTLCNNNLAVLLLFSAALLLLSVLLLRLSCAFLAGRSGGRSKLTRQRGLTPDQLRSGNICREG